jgi:hypothetical protein
MPEVVLIVVAPPTVGEIILIQKGHEGVFQQAGSFLIHLQNVAPRVGGRLPIVPVAQVFTRCCG